MRRLGFLLMCGALGACSSVNGLVEKAGRLIDGSAFAFNTEERWRPLHESSLDVRIGTTAQGERFMRWTLTELPWLVFYGTVPDGAGNFSLAKMHFLAGSYSGWIEYECEIAGQGRFRLFGASNGAWTLTSQIERGEITGGKIRHSGTRLIDERALGALQNRDERITHLTDWMDTLERRGFTTQKEFETYWRPRIFPRGRREKAAAPLLPELLRSKEMRDALLSDWNEAPVWIYLDYDWKKLLLVFNNEFIMIKEDITKG